MNDLRALIDAATPDRAPGFERVLARRARRTRRRHAVVAGAGAVGLVAAAILAVQVERNDNEHVSPAPPALSPSRATSPPPTVDRTELAYTWSNKRSPLVIRLPDRDVSLTAWLGCWDGPTGSLDCVEERPAPVAQLPDIGSPEGIDFWFGVQGWTFEATFTQLGVDCPRAESTRSVATRDHWFHLAPAGLAGDYRVDLVGQGPHGGEKGVPTAMSLVWHTPMNAPVDRPRAQVSDSELVVHALGYEPTAVSADVTVTDANGQATTRQLPLNSGSDPCSQSVDEAWPFDDEQHQGELFFQGDFDDPAIAALGPEPFSYRVRLILDGDRYFGTAGNNGRVTWSPPLPAYTG